MDNNLVPLRRSPVRNGIPDAPHFMTLPSEGWGEVGKPPPPRMEPVPVDVSMGGVELVFEGGFMVCHFWDDTIEVVFKLTPIVAEEIAAAFHAPKDAQPMDGPSNPKPSKFYSVGECALYRGEATEEALFLFIRSSDRDALVRLRIPLDIANRLGATWRDAVASMRAKPRAEREAVIEYLPSEERANHRVAKWTREEEERANRVEAAPPAAKVAPPEKGLLERMGDAWTARSNALRMFSVEAKLRVKAAIRALVDGTGSDDD
jgi:hypothetical protein